MSTTTKIALGAAAGLLVIGAISLLEDETPIRVRGGSMEIDGDPAGNGKWGWELEDANSANPRYSHNAIGFSLALDLVDSGLWVKILPGSANLNCPDLTFHGQPVVIEHQGGFSVMLVRAGVNKRIKVPRNNLTLQDSVLRYQSEGYITSVAAQGPEGGSCAFMSPEQLSYIWICTSASQAECQ